MAETGRKEEEISLGDDWDVMARDGGTTVELNVGGGVVHTDGDVKARLAENDSGPLAGIPSAVRRPGDRMMDGTIFAGVSPDTGNKMYTTPADAPLTMQWDRAMKYARNLDAHGHKDWRVPTKRELDVIFRNRTAIGGFDLSGSYPAGWYWSSMESGSNACDQRFSDGYHYWFSRLIGSSLRCVR